MDAKLADQFGATAQFKFAPASNSDDRYTGTVSWAFLSWRPSNDWLFRAGKQRIPLYLYSQTRRHRGHVRFCPLADGDVFDHPEQ